MAYEDSDFYSTSEKKWKLFKRDSSNNTRSSSNNHHHHNIDSNLTRSFSSKNTSSKSPPFLRSFSQKTSSKLSRSSSLKSSCPSSPTLRRSASSKNKSTLMRSFSKKSNAFGKKCTNLAKEQKARFYIMKRCVSMLVSWPRKNGDS